MRQVTWCAVFLVLVLSLSAVSCRVPLVGQGPWERTELLLDTVVRVVAYGPEAESRAALAAAVAELERQEAVFSLFHPDSELDVINRTSMTKAVRLSDDMAAVLGRAAELWALTDGAFDPSLGWLTMLYKQADGVPPTAADIRTGLAHRGYQRVDLDLELGTVQLPTSSMMLDLGGIAKGYAVDRAIAILRGRGVSAGMVVAGGSVRVFGDKPTIPGEWVVGVQHPRDPSALLAEVRVTDQAVDTAGDYQRFFFHEGRRYHHIIDPDTGEPADGAIAVTIVAPDAVTADGLSTGVFVLGVDRGMELVESIPGVEALIVAPDGRVVTSSGFPGKVLTKQVDPGEGRP